MNDPKKVLLFDFDGVVIDNFEQSFAAAEELYPGLTKEQYRNWHAENVYRGETMKREMGELRKNPVTPEQWARIYERMILGCVPVNGVPDALYVLVREMDYAIAVISSAFSDPIRLFLNKHDLSSYFSEILGGDLEYDKRKKIREVMKRYHISPERTLMVTDTTGDIGEAHEVGVQSIAVGWGYHSEEFLKAAHPASIVHAPSDLPGEIMRLLGS